MSGWLAVEINPDKWRSTVEGLAAFNIKIPALWDVTSCTPVCT